MDEIKIKELKKLLITEFLEDLEDLEELYDDLYERATTAFSLLGPANVLNRPKFDDFTLWFYDLIEKWEKRLDKLE